MSGASVVFAFGVHEAIREGGLDDYLDQMLVAVSNRLHELALDDRSHLPTQPLPPGQVWVWMNGPGKGHWAVRGTGALLDQEDEKTPPG